MDPTVTTIGDRLEIVDTPSAEATSSFAEDVELGLSSRPKYLSSKYLYDDLGSALFEAITKLPEYYLTRAESEILRESGWEIVRALDAPLEFLELGSGSAVKTRLLIGEALRVQKNLRYSPIDISRDALQTSSEALVDAHPQLAIRAYAGDYFTVLNSPELRFEKKVLAMFMGSNIGNYEPAQARALLQLLGSRLRPGDGLLLGADLKKNREAVEAAYDDAAGVTSAFNRNMLGRINRELGGTFVLSDFEHIARYDARRGCVDSYLRARRACSVTVGKIGRRYAFSQGESIHTESSYKFDDASITALAAASGFRLGKKWQDARKRFGVHLLIREG